jgi:hypothetical protein
MNSGFPEGKDTDQDRSYPRGYWRKSSFSGSTGDCIEVTALNGAQVGVRDSKAPTGPYLRFHADAWSNFVGGLRRGPAPGGK